MERDSALERKVWRTLRRGRSVRTLLSETSQSRKDKCRTTPLTYGTESNQDRREGKREAAARGWARKTGGCRVVGAEPRC